MGEEVEGGQGTVTAVYTMEGMGYPSTSLGYRCFMLQGVQVGLLGLILFPMDGVAVELEETVGQIPTMVHCTLLLLGIRRITMAHPTLGPEGVVVDGVTHTASIQCPSHAELVEMAAVESSSCAGALPCLVVISYRFVATAPTTRTLEISVSRVRKDLRALGA